MFHAIARLPLIRNLRPNLTSRYNRAAQNWHRAICRLGYIDAYKALISKSLNTQEFHPRTHQISVLDAGAGSGGFSLALAQTIPNPLSIDLLDSSSNMLKAAAATLAHLPHKTEQICADIQSIDTMKKSYDIILCAHLIDHLNNPVPALKSLGAALKPGGMLLLVVSKPHWCTALIQLRWHHNAYRSQEVIDLLRQACVHRVIPFSFDDGPPKFTSKGYIVCSITPNSSQ